VYRIIVLYKLHEKILHPKKNEWTKKISRKMSFEKVFSKSEIFFSSNQTARFLWFLIFRNYRIKVQARILSNLQISLVSENLNQSRSFFEIIQCRKLIKGKGNFFTWIERNECDKVEVEFFFFNSLNTQRKLFIALEKSSEGFENFDEMGIFFLINLTLKKKFYLLISQKIQSRDP